MSSVLDYIRHYQKNIEKCPGDEKRVLRCIDKLDRLPVTVQHLQDTGVGRTVNALRKDHGEVGKASKALVAKWKLMVAEEEESDDETQQEEIEEEDEDNSDTLRESEIDQRDRNNHSAYLDLAKSESDRKRKHEEKPNDHNKRSKTDSRDSTSHKKYQSDSDASENIHYKDSRNSCDSDSNHSNKYTANKSSENNDDSDMENKYTNYKHEKTKHRSHSKSEDSYKSKSLHHSSKEKSHHKEKNSIPESPKDKHNSKNSKNNKSEKKESKDSGGRNKHSDEKHQKHSEEKHQKHSSENKTSSNHKSSSSSSSRSHSDSRKHKETSNSSDLKSVEKNHSSKSKEKEKESKSKDEKKSSSGSKHDGPKTESKDKHQSTRHKSTDGKESSSKKSSKDGSKKEKLPENVHDDGIGCESGASFAEALGMISHSPTKKKSGTTTSREPSNKSSDVKKSDFKSPSDKKEQKLDKNPSSSSKVDTSLLNPDFKLEPLPPLEISALPEISPNYKPRPPPKLLNSFHLEEEAMSSVMGNKNQRTKVYSGNKSYGYVPSLYELCVIVLQENIDALEYTGGVPYEILKPVVDKATPDQLFMLEHYNPYLMEDTDLLWQKHCEKKFRSLKRQELETWREMYMRCLDEQEAKLKSLTANIKMSQDMKKAPTRLTKMAYVDSVVKPPRGIARKQAIYGTAKLPVVSPAARVASLATGNVVKAMDAKVLPSSSESSAPRSSGFIKPKKAPLMQKALQFMKGRRKR